LRPLYPGQAAAVRLNLYNVVLVFDFARSSSLQFITNTLSMLIDRMYPVRFGIVPIIETEDSVKMAKVFYYLIQNYGRQATMRFFSSVHAISFCHCFHSCPFQIVDGLDGPKKQLDLSHVQKEFEALVASEEIKQGRQATSFDDVVGSAPDELETKLSKARKYAERLGTTSASSPDGHIFINGKYYVLNGVRCHDWS
jgi:UDP-glucose:glycoprotein glucosyltransferase